MKKIIILLIATFLSFSFSENELVFANGIKIGDRAPSFNLKNIDGKKYSLENITDANGKKPKGYILVFTCNTCPYAKANENRLIQLHDKYAPKGYPVVAIQPNDPAVQPGDSFDAMKKNDEEKAKLVKKAIEIRNQINEKYNVQHPEKSFIKGLTHIEFSSKKVTHKDINFKNTVIVPPGGIDRSPCGTGTSAKMATLVYKKELKNRLEEKYL